MGPTPIADVKEAQAASNIPHKADAQLQSQPEAQSESARPQQPALETKAQSESGGAPADAANTASQPPPVELNLKNVVKAVLKYVAMIIAPIMLFYLPMWVSTRFLRLDVTFTAAEFWERCNRGDLSLEDPHRKGLNVYTTWLFTCLFVPTYWVLPHEGVPPADADQDLQVYREGCRQTSKLWSRQIFGGLFAACFFFVAVFGAIQTVTEFMEAEVATEMFTTAFTIGLLMATFGIVVQAVQLKAKWVDSWLKRIVGAFVIFSFFVICQMFVINGPRVLDENGDIGLVVVMLVANGVVALLKQWTMRTGGDLGVLSMFSMAVGAAAGIFLRQYVFMKPTIVDSIVASVLSSAVTASGHVFNYLVFKFMKVHDMAAATHGVILFSDQVFEVAVRIICAAVLLAADTRYYAIGKFGFGEKVDAGLVVFNFCTSMLLQVLVGLMGVKLMHSGTKFDLEKWGGSFKAWHAAVAAACTFGITIFFAIGFRGACLQCMPPDHRDAYVCFD